MGTKPKQDKPIQTTVRLPPELHKRLKVYAAKNGTTMQRYLEALIRVDLSV